jgi:hypothetical protein
MYGRGVSDAKGIIAAQVAAAEALRAGVSDWAVVCVRRRARLGGREGREPLAQGQPLSDQRRADRQSPGAGVEGRAARGVSRDGQDGALGVSRAGRERGAQAGAGAGEAAGAAAAGDRRTLGRAR